MLYLLFQSAIFYPNTSSNDRFGIKYQMNEKVRVVVADEGGRYMNKDTLF